MAITLNGTTSTISATRLTGATGSAYINLNTDNSMTFGANIDIDVTNNFLFGHTNTATIPPADHTTIWGKGLAKRGLISCMGASGMDYPLQPSIWRQKIGLWTPPGNSTTVPGVVGFAAPTAVGTATARNVATTNVSTRMRRLGYVSAATAAALAGQYITVAQFTVGSGGGTDGSGFFYSCRFIVSDAAAVAGARMFVGLSSTVAAPTNVEPTTLLNSIGIAQLSTDNTQLYIVYGGSAAQAAIPLGTTFTPLQGTVNAFDLTLFAPPSLNGVINYRVDKINTGEFVEGTITPGTVGVQTPLSTTLLAHRAWRTNNATLLAVGLDICNIYLETDF